MRRHAFASLVLVLIALPAAADWQFTKWGMTPEQVIKKSPVRLSRVPAAEADKHLNTSDEKGLASTLEGDWTSGSFRFHAYFQFDAGRHLAAVDLEIPDDAVAVDVANALEKKYGQPTREDNSTPMFRSWETPSDIIYFHGPLPPFREAKGFHGSVTYLSRKGIDNSKL